MPIVGIEPLGVQVHAHEGETVMDAALRCGYAWPTVCHGEGSCAACRLEVVEGAGSLSPVGDDERSALARLVGKRAQDSTVRLACQATVLGDVVVRKKGVRPMQDS